MAELVAFVGAATLQEDRKLEPCRTHRPHNFCGEKGP